MPFTLPIEYFLITSSDCDCLTYLPSEAVSEAVCHLCSELRLCSPMDLQLVFQDPTVFFCLVVVPDMLGSSSVEVSARLAMVTVGLSSGHRQQSMLYSMLHFLQS